MLSVVLETLAVVLPAGVFPVLCVALCVGLAWMAVRRTLNWVARSWKVRTSGRTVLVTGCDSGFGLLAAQQLERMGFDVIAACLTDDGVRTVTGKATRRGGITGTKLNVMSSASIGELAAFVEKQCPDGLFGLVNNAGIIEFGPADWTTMASYRRVADVNLFGLIEVTKALLPALMRARGRVVNIASVAGFLSAPALSAYSVSKFGVEAFSDSLRLEMNAWDVGVCIVEPGFFATPLTSAKTLLAHMDRVWESVDDEKRARYGERMKKTFAKVLVHGLSTFCDKRPQKVSDAVCEALSSRLPRERYLVGTDANYLWWFLVRIPTPVLDFFLVR